jgi:hypothetical protein
MTRVISGIGRRGWSRPQIHEPQEHKGKRRLEATGKSLGEVNWTEVGLNAGSGALNGAVVGGIAGSGAGLLTVVIVGASHGTVQAGAEFALDTVFGDDMSDRNVAAEMAGGAIIGAVGAGAGSVLGEAGGFGAGAGATLGKEVLDTGAGEAVANIVGAFAQAASELTASTCEAMGCD